MSEAVYLWVSGGVSGPYELHELAQLVEMGRVSLSDTWSLDGVNDWRALREIVTVEEPDMKPTTRPCPDCDGVVSLRAEACPHCGAPFVKTGRTTARQVPPMPPEQDVINVTRRKLKSEMMGTGCIMQGVGVAVLFYFWPVGLALLAAGSLLSYRWVCGNCRNKIDKGSRLCPACQYTLK